MCDTTYIRIELLLNKYLKYFKTFVILFLEHIAERWVKVLELKKNLSRIIAKTFIHALNTLGIIMKQKINSTNLV